MLTLYHHILCPYSRALRMALKEKNLPFLLLGEQPGTDRAEFRALNPSGDVPVLVGGDGTIIVESYAIREYLEELFPETPLLGVSPEERAEIRRLVQWFEDRFHREVTQNILFEKFFKRLMGYGEPYSEAIRAGKSNLRYHLEYIEYLTSDRRFLAGDQLTYADLAASAHLSCLDYLGDVPWDDFQGAADWYALMKSRPSLRLILADRSPGMKPPAHYEDPDF